MVCGRQVTWSTLVIQPLSSAWRHFRSCFYIRRYAFVYIWQSGTVVCSEPLIKSALSRTERSSASAGCFNFVASDPSHPVTSVYDDDTAAAVFKTSVVFYPIGLSSNDATTLKRQVVVCHTCEIAMCVMYNSTRRLCHDCGISVTESVKNNQCTVYRPKPVTADYVQCDYGRSQEAKAWTQFPGCF